MTLTQDRVRQLFGYHEDGGLVVLQRRHGSHYPIGSVLIATQADPYFRISIDGVLYLLHRIIYLWHTGKLPAFLDHRDTNPRNNRIGNLRPATKRENNRNVPKKCVGGSRFKGVVWRADCKKWRAVIKPADRQVSLGYFDKEEDAARAYDAAALRYFGLFACLNFSGVK